MSPAISETFWRIYQPFKRNQNFALLDIFHFNSLEDKTYLKLESEFKLGNVLQSGFIPARLINNIDQYSNHVLENREMLITEQTEFLVQRNDGTWWIDDTYL